MTPEWPECVIRVMTVEENADFEREFRSWKEWSREEAEGYAALTRQARNNERDSPEWQKAIEKLTIISRASPVYNNPWPKYMKEHLAKR